LYDILNLGRERAEEPRVSEAKLKKKGRREAKQKSRRRSPREPRDRKVNRRTGKADSQGESKADQSQHKRVKKVEHGEQQRQALPQRRKPAEKHNTHRADLKNSQDELE
jgi:hypothetical protein